MDFKTRFENAAGIEEKLEILLYAILNIAQDSSKRFDRLEQKFSRIEQRLNRVEQKIGKVETLNSYYIQTFRLLEEGEIAGLPTPNRVPKLDAVIFSEDEERSLLEKYR